MVIKISVVAFWQREIFDLKVVKYLNESKSSSLSPPGKSQNRNQFVFFSFGVDPLNWRSFIEIGEMACSTTAWCSRGHALKLRCTPISLYNSLAFHFNS